ncbi:FAD/NAD(P)-binding protein [Kitasatospora sp. NPDC059160]|uniref:FAD/NAD(P)-binding protein n=1 Tax=Kitasatospora sp. NPDC059160 TaxID=3346748 RepID=UPI00368B4B0F
MSGEKQTRVIGVIGAGPRGLSVVERLTVNATEGGHPVVIHVVDPFVGSGGRVWDITQPTELLMNTVASQVTMFTDPSVTCEGPIRPGPSLYEWAKLDIELAPLEYPGWVSEEAAELGPDSYPSRAFYGHYLVWVLDRLISTAPDHVSIRLHRNTAVSLTEAEDGSQIVTLDDGSGLLLDSVVLAQGHLDMPPSAGELGLEGYARAQGLGYLPPTNPAEADLDFVAPGQPVALRGLGLNFFDYLTLLTAGRGGTFVREGERLRYRPSGREPLMYAGSRRGIPYHARGENQKGAFGRHWPSSRTMERINVLREQRRLGAEVEFTRHIWPLVDREVTGVYYHALISERRGGEQADAFLREYGDRPPGADDEELLGRFGLGPADRWDWDAIARPYGERKFLGRVEFQDWLLGHLRQDLVEARRGNVGGALKAALDVMRDLRNEVRLLVDHAGITGESYRDELQSWYTPLNAYVSIGPPPRRIEELIALVEAGVVTMLAPGMRVTPAPAGAGFTVDSTSVPGGEVEVTALIEARLPEVDIRTTEDPLVRNLVDRRACRPYLIPTGTDGHVETGGLTVTERPYRLVDAAGRVHPYRYAFGVPTETVHWATAAGIRPGVDSVILGDADAIARACLSAEPGQRSPSAARVRVTL